MRADLGHSKPELIQRTPDWGLAWEKNYTLYTWRIWRMSNFQVYPNGLSFDHQPQSLIDSFMELNEEYAYHKHFLMDEKSE